MKRTVQGQRQGDGFVLVDRQISVAKIGTTVVAIAGALVAILRCIVEAGVL
jgi:hypothetical protein